VKEIGNNKHGTTLIEILISIILVAITTLGGIALFFNASQLQGIVRHKKIAVEMANSKMEECRRSACTAGTSNITIEGLNIENGLTIQDETSKWADYNHKTVRIGWDETGPTSRTFNVSFTTLVHQ